MCTLTTNGHLNYRSLIRIELLSSWAPFLILGALIEEANFFMELLEKKNILQNTKLVTNLFEMCQRTENQYGGREMEIMTDLCMRHNFIIHVFLGKREKNPTTKVVQKIFLTKHNTSTFLQIFVFQMPGRLPYILEKKSPTTQDTCMQNITHKERKTQPLLPSETW